MAGAIIAIIVFYLLHVRRGYVRLRRVNKKKEKWGLEEGKKYQIQNKHGFWFDATFIDPFFTRPDSSFTVDIDDVFDAKPLN
jgi:hypothetical protein